MPIDTDRDYLERREREALTAAERAANPGIAKLHRDFAEQYRNALKRIG